MSASFRRDLALGLLAGIVAGVGYVLLHGALPYHDAARFADQVSGNRLVWDVGHVLLQPTALILTRLSGMAPVTVLKSLSSAATAAAVGLFCLLLLRLRCPGWQVILGTLVLATACSVLTLAPSAHPKLTAFPFINGALACCCLAERERRVTPLMVVATGVLLGIGAGYLASVVATMPFVAAALFVLARRGGLDPATAAARGILFLGVSGGVLACILAATYVGCTTEPVSLAGIAGSVHAKADLRPPPLSLPVHLARVMFGTINNLIAIPRIGATAQAWMRGQIPSLAAYAGLLPLLALWVLIGLLIALVYAAAGLALWRRWPCIAPVAFLAGAQTWTIWYGLNDPEHWFQLTAPTILLCLMALPRTLVRSVLPLWAVIGAAVNLWLLAIPVARYPLAAYDHAVRDSLGPRDLVLYFTSYPGRPYVGFLGLPPTQGFAVDAALQQPGASVASVLDQMDARIAATVHAGGRVLVADILDPLDWEAPWMFLLSRHLTKAALYRHLQAAGTPIPLPAIGGIQWWQLQPTATDEAARRGRTGP